MGHKYGTRDPLSFKGKIKESLLLTLQIFTQTASSYAPNSRKKGSGPGTQQIFLPSYLRLNQQMRLFRVMKAPQLIPVEQHLIPTTQNPRSMNFLETLLNLQNGFAKKEQ